MTDESKDQAKQTKHAVLPEGLTSHKHSIASMDIGSLGWTFPWAMYHDYEHKLWLNGSYAIRAQSIGSGQMKIWRDEEGWHVDARECRDHQWSVGGYGNVGRFQPIAVATFIYD